jgi:hypothetical protein
MEREFSYPVVRELDGPRSEAPPAAGEPLAPPRRNQRELVLESLIRRPDGGSAGTRR